MVKRASIDGYQLWSTAQLENKLIDMREMYNEKITGIERYYLIPLLVNFQYVEYLRKAMFMDKLIV